MNQEWLMKKVLEHRHAVPDSACHGRAYLSLDEAQAIVDETIDFLGEHGEETEYAYIRGHRKRLAHSLSMIPKAQDHGESCLDVGCYGYMLLWAKKHLGYDRVVGIEWHPEKSEAVIQRVLTVENESIEIFSYNFDISAEQWAIDEQFDTVLFFEVLEHINHDPMGVMERIHQRLKLQGTLVMSVPNAISYKTLKEFLVGMPPWTYWFYEPDLSHEPRHCFEYTPLVFKALIRATGLTEDAFRTIYAYTEPEHESKALEIAQALGFSPEDFGETMIIHATKASDQLALRHPDVLYSPEGYYNNVYPLLQAQLSQVHTQFAALIAPPEINQASDTDDLLHTCELQLRRIEEFEEQKTIADQTVLDAQREAQRAQSHNTELLTRIAELESDLNQSLFHCDCYLQKEQDIQTKIESAERAQAAAMIEAKDTRTWAETLAKDNADLSGRVNELLFACDCYLQQVNDPTRCVQVIREQRFRSVLRVSKSVARKTPVLRTVLRPVYRNTKSFIKRRM